MTVFVSRDFLVIVINNSFKKLSYVSFLAERVVLIFDIYDYVSLQGLFFKCSSGDSVIYCGVSHWL